MAFDVTSKLVVAMSATGNQQVQQSIGGVGAAIAGTTQKSAAAGAQAKITGAQFAALSNQVQDFAIQVQAGGSPLTALLQQTSQLSGQFGGLGNALSVARSAITPTAVVIGGLALGIGAVTLAFKQGREETDAWTRSLVLSGNAAGVTTGMLRTLAEDQAALAGTQGKAAQVQQQLIESGVIAGAQFSKATQAVIAMERAGGPAIEATTKKLVDLGRSPLATLVKLNEAEHFLTLEVYNQVKALEDQGRKTDAAAVAQSAYANTAIDRAKALETQLGSLQKAWRGVGEGAAKAWDFMLGIGRPRTPEQELAEIEKALAAQPQPRRGGNTLQADARRQAMAQRAEDLRMEIYMSREAAAAQQADAEKVTKTIDNMADELAAKAAHVQAAFAIAAARIKASIADLESKAARGLLSPIEAIEQVADKNIELLRKEKDEIGGLIGVAKERGAKEAEMAGLRAQYAVKDIEITAAIADKNNKVAEAMYKRQVAAREAYRTELEEGEKLLADYQSQAGRAYSTLVDQVRDYARGIDETNEGLQLEASLIGASDRVRSVMLAQLQVELERRRQIRAIDEAKDIGPDERATLRAGVNEAAARASAMAESQVFLAEWKKTSDQINGTLTDAIVGAFENGGADAAKQFGKMVERMFLDMVLRPTIASALQPVSNYLGGYLSGAGGAGGGGGNWLANASSLYGGGKSLGLFGSSSASAGSAAAGTFVDVGGQGAAINASLADYGITSGATTAASGASAIPIIGWILAALAMSDAAYKGGNNSSMISDKVQWGTPGGALSHLTEETLSGLGFNDRWAQVLSGAPLVARLFGHKASSSGFGVGSVSGGDFVTDSRRPFQFGDNTLGTGADSDLQGLAKDIAAAIGIQAGNFGGKLQEGLRVGTFTDRDREGQVSALLGFLNGDKLVAGTQTGSGTFGAGGPTGAASKIEGADLQQWFAQQMPVLMIQGLQQSDLAPRFKEYFDAIANDSKLTSDKASELLNTATAVQRLTESFAPLGGVFTQFGVISVDTFKKLSDAGGGFDALSQSVATYYQAYYSESERAQIATDNVTKALASVGLTMPDLAAGSEAAHAQFRALVDAQDLSTDSGRKAFNQLMGISGVFDQVAAASEKAAQAERERVKKINDTKQGLELELLRAQGNETGALALQRQIELASLTALEVETGVAAKTFTDLKLQVYQASDAAQIAADNLAKLKSLASGVDSVVGGFLSGGALQNYFADRILQTLGEAGITGTRAGVLGSTKQDILDLWNAVGVDGKQAILTALPMWEQLQDQVLKTSGVANSMSDLLAAYNEINPAAETLVDKWRKSRQEMELLQQALDDIDGKPAATKLGQLQDLVNRRSGLAGVQNSLVGLIDDARTSKRDQAAVNYLRAGEANAASRFATTNDPAIAQQWIALTQKRVQMEAELEAKAQQDIYDAKYAGEMELYNLAKQTDTLLTRQQRDQRDALQAQIDGLTRIKELAKTIPEVLGNIQAGDLSTLSYSGRLAEREKLFQSSLDTGNDPAGALQAYLQQLQSVYGGGTSEYVSAADKARADYEAKITQGAIDADSLLPPAMQQLNQLQKLADKAMPELKKAVVDSSDEMVLALTGINTSIVGGLGALTTDIRTLFGQAQSEVSAYEALIAKYVAPFLVPGEIGPDGTKWDGGGSGGGYGEGAPELQFNWAPLNDGFGESLGTQTVALKGEFKSLKDEVVALKEAVVQMAGKQIVQVAAVATQEAGLLQQVVDNSKRRARTEDLTAAMAR